MSDLGRRARGLLPLTWLFMVVFAVAFVAGVLLGRAGEDPSQKTEVCQASKRDLAERLPNV